MEQLIFCKTNSSNSLCFNKLGEYFNLIFLVKNRKGTFLLNTRSLNFLRNNTCIVRGRTFRFFRLCLFNILIGLAVGWIVRFMIVGYHYTIKLSKSKKLLKLRLGFRYKILIVLPVSIFIFVEKRRFLLVGLSLIDLVEICKYIRNLRNLFPYKRKGIAFVSEVFKLKRGKRAKLH
jgi:ribosomal protein L6P/L9E